MDQKWTVNAIAKSNLHDWVHRVYFALLLFTANAFFVFDSWGLFLSLFQLVQIFFEADSLFYFHVYAISFFFFNPWIVLINQCLKRMNAFLFRWWLFTCFLRIKKLLRLDAGLNDSLVMDFFCGKCRLFSASNVLYLPRHCTMQPVRLTCELCQKIPKMKDSFESSSKRNQVFQPAFETATRRCQIKIRSNNNIFPFFDCD